MEQQLQLEPECPDSPSRKPSKNFDAPLLEAKMSSSSSRQSPRSEGPTGPRSSRKDSDAHPPTFPHRHD